MGTKCFHFASGGWLFYRTEGEPDIGWKMEENLMEDFKVFCDEEEDILYLGREGFWNFHPGLILSSMNPAA